MGRTETLAPAVLSRVSSFYGDFLLFVHGGTHDQVWGDQQLEGQMRAQFALLILIFCLIGFLVGHVDAAQVASDNAGNSTYSAGWFSEVSNGGSGWVGRGFSELQTAQTTGLSLRRR
jgi:hypothetical protein